MTVRERVLGVLADGEEHWGYEVMRVLGAESGSVYPVLRELERAGLVGSRWVERRRYYRMVGGCGE